MTVVMKPGSALMVQLPITDRALDPTLATATVTKAPPVRRALPLERTARTVEMAVTRNQDPAPIMSPVLDLTLALLLAPAPTLSPALATLPCLSLDPAAATLAILLSRHLDPAATTLPADPRLMARTRLSPPLSSLAGHPLGRSPRLPVLWLLLSLRLLGSSNPLGSDTAC